MKNIFFLFFALLVACGTPSTEDKLTAENDPESDHTIVSKPIQMRDTAVSLPNTIIRRLKSEINGQDYLIKVAFPRGYQDSKKSYPVLYVMDAETNFGGVTYIVQRLIKDRLLPEIIVVGVAYDTDYDQFYALRSRDLTPVEDKNLTIAGVLNPTGGAPLFASFLEQELFPFVAENFRIKENDRTLYGHSYGGLFGCYVLLNKPELFNRYLLLSPSLWFKENKLIDDVKHSTFKLPKTLLYLASGEREVRIHTLQTEFADILKGQDHGNLQLKAEVLDNETHRTIFGRGFTNGLRYLFE